MQMMVDIRKIKLIIWDLDDTLWTGTISEGGANLPIEHKQLIIALTDTGIINSICSKNDYEPIKEELQKLGLWEYFVFPSINWENKGQRIKHMIDQMALRPINVLFVDDNTFNLQEAKHCLPDLQIATPEIIIELLQQIKLLPKSDISHKRLKQYKVLEEKAQAAQAFDSNEEFLYASNIRVVMHTDCLSNIERIHELIMRSNQLNYTKKRISLDELEILLNNPEYQCGYVTVTDNYGDYGLVGFYAKGSNGLEHYLFSCRTMGQMIEQYVYAQLGYPELQVVGEVRTQLNKIDSPRWINQTNQVEKNIEHVKKLSCNILLKGPCDLSNAQSYIYTKEKIVSEFTYVKDDSGQVIDTHNHSVHIRALHEYSDEINRQLISDCPFIDPKMLNGTFFTGQYDVIFLSSLIESVYPIYQKKDSNIRVVYRQAVDKDREEKFFENYEYIGLTTPEEYKRFLLDCLSWLPKQTTLCIILGATLPLSGYEATAQRHALINGVVKDLATHNNRLRYIEVDEFISSEKDITDHINHYQTRVYFEIAQAMIRVIKDVTGQDVTSIGRQIIWFDNLIKTCKTLIKRIITPNNRSYHILKRVYLLLSRRKDNIV